LFIDSAWQAFCAMVGVVFATVFAYFLGINRSSIRSGLFGFNGMLLGMSKHNQDLLKVVSQDQDFQYFYPESGNGRS